MLPHLVEGRQQIASAVGLLFGPIVHRASVGGHARGRHLQNWHTLHALRRDERLGGRREARLAFQDLLQCGRRCFHAVRLLLISVTSMPLSVKPPRQHGQGVGALPRSNGILHKSVCRGIRVEAPK
eukprot:9466169-Pyramimonas_sp.AAC.1